VNDNEISVLKMQEKFSNLHIANVYDDVVYEKNNDENNVQNGVENRVVLGFLLFNLNNNVFIQLFLCK
jgi:hypothetical protein